ncbi:MAG TPA: hypothetical protein VF765_01400 [Polyangiaceae bacterium]
MRIFLPALAASLLLASTAAAQEAPKPAPAEEQDDFVSHMHPGFGARVGGYGFWSPTKTVWDDCPMGGVGIFGTLDVTKNLYVEAALDQYDSTPILGDTDGVSMSRISVLTSGAIGLRMFPEFVIVPHIEVGAGMEWTRVEELSQKVEGVYPLGFISIGGELNVFKHIKAGADLRFLGMAKPYEDSTQQVAPGVAEGTVKMEMMPAAQGLFYARYVL